MVTRLKTCLLILLGATSFGVVGAESGAGWSWELRGYRIPNFVGKSSLDGSRVVLVEVLFRNTATEARKLVLGTETFKAATSDGQPAEIVDLIYRSRNMEGATQIQFVGPPPKQVQKLTEEHDCTVDYAVMAATIEATIPAGKTYKQRVLLARPASEQSVRLTFGELPALVILLPK